MYQALYRKYRPATFDEVVGQEVIVKTLKNEILNDQLNHAYLFAGPRGTGKTSVAKILAKVINCEDAKDLVPCDKCVSCTQINNHQSTDIIEIDAASNNGVDEIRELKSKVNLVPSVSKYKVYIIDEIHMLSTSAFNALLKTLEEPPANVIFILATTNPQKIPNTVLSRCQRFNFKPLTDEQIYNLLKNISQKEKIKVEAEALLEIARLADGGLRDAIVMLDQADSYCDKKITVKDVHDINGTITQEGLEDCIYSILTADYNRLFTILDDFTKMGKDIAKVTSEIIYYLRNILLLYVAPEYCQNNYIDIKKYNKILKITSQEIVGQTLTILNNELNNIKSSSDAKTSLEITLVKIMNDIIANKNDISQELKAEAEIALVKPVDEPKDEAKIALVKPVDESKDIIKTNKVDDIKIEQPKVKVSKPKQNSDVLGQLQALKDIRVNNALAQFSKKDLLALRKKEDNIRSLLLDSDFGNEASVLLDGELKAVGGNNLIFVFANENMSNIFNTSLLKIEATIKKAFDFEYKAISVPTSEWEIIKKAFNNKTKEYVKMDEPDKMMAVLKRTEQLDDDEIKNLFGSIVEYK